MEVQLEMASSKYNIYIYCSNFVFRKHIICDSGCPADLEFLENWKSQGILWHLQNVREKSGNFVKFGKVREFYLREMNIAEVLHKNKLL